MKYILLLFCLAYSLVLSAQTITLEGKVTDQKTEEPIELVTVYIKGTNINDDTDDEGKFLLEVPRQKSVIIVFTRLGYEEVEMKVRANRNRYTVNTTMLSSLIDLDVTITDSRTTQQESVRETTEAIKLLPSTTGNLESVLPHIALGASGGTGGELSSQYNVRGGNYDENLVYVNDFEVFRPQLLRSSQQEGLSFPNTDLIRDLTFSSGGYQSKYGDKMSSVLDISYKRPTDFHGSAAASLLGFSTHLEGSALPGANDNNRFKYLVGYRFKTNKYLLNSLDTEGEYNPEFTDLQTYLTYDISSSLQLGVLANYNTSEYRFIPQSRTSGLGQIGSLLELNTVFEGAEEDRFRTGMVGASLTFLPEVEKNPRFLKLISSQYRGKENESVDVLGFYRLSQVERDLENGGETREVGIIGLGAQQTYLRNRLFNNISTVQLRGGIELQSDQDRSKTHFLQSGVTFRKESFDDRLNEWELLDSAGYSLPYNTDQVLLNHVLKSENEISSTKLTGFIQDTYTVQHDDGKELKLTLGSRFSYWDLNKEFNISPRAQLLFRPAGDADISYKLAAGIYYQTPFYRELRQLDGSLNTDIQAQKSLHIVGGLTKDFHWTNLSDRPFKFIAEAYYKKLDDLISYEINNVRIRYSGQNDASGSVMGLDLRLNGEFVPGAESWFNLSLLSARESLDGVQHQSYDANSNTFEEINSVRRPTDQFLHFSIFFQDYLPSNENFKVNFLLTYGSGLPFGIPENNIVTRNPVSYEPYRRVDIGLSLQLWNKDWRKNKPNHLFRSMDNAWVSLEVFNLIGIENTSSNTWIKSIFAQQYAVPNRLTTRRINLKFKVEF